MYLGFFRLKEMPFRLAPDPRFLYASAAHTAALEQIRGVRERDGGCAILIGARGAGKTSLLEFLQHQCGPGATRRIDFPPRTRVEFEDWLRHDAEAAAGSHPLLLCDNAHLFHESLLTALLRDAAPRCLLLAGEPALARTLELPALAALARHGERVPLPPLGGAEVPDYIAHRLRIAGGDGARIFSAEACADIHRETKGNPRLVNAVCDAAMILACERERLEIGSAEIRQAFDDVGRLLASQAGADATAPAVPDEEPPSPRNGRAFARLRLVHGDRVVLERELAPGALTIGRSEDNGLCIESKFVSRHHCRIVTGEQRCILEDVHSTNGLFVNQHRVRRHRMRDGDVVQIGEHRLHYFDLRD